MSGFKPRLTIGPWRCPHYKSFHHVPPDGCNDPWRMWEGHMPEGTIKSCGVAADRRGLYSTIKSPWAQAMQAYQKKLKQFARRMELRAKRKAA